MTIIWYHLKDEFLLNIHCLDVIGHRGNEKSSEKHPFLALDAHNSKLKSVTPNFIVGKKSVFYR